jgi:transposase InsO family protein
MHSKPPSGGSALLNTSLQTVSRYSPPLQNGCHKNRGGDAFGELLDSWKVKSRLGAIGKHGSIAVTERAIKTLKHEWLNRVPLIRGFKHLSELCKRFSDWYNVWRPHSLLEGACPDQWYRRDVPETVDRESKVVPSDVERRVFPETGIVGFKLREAA